MLVYAIISLGYIAIVVIQLRAFGPKYTFMYIDCCLNNNNKCHLYCGAFYCSNSYPWSFFPVINTGHKDLTCMAK